MTNLPVRQIPAIALALAVGATGIMVLPPIAAAASDEDEAKRHWVRGRELYEAGDPVGAIREWEEGWILSRRPAFLLNIAQAYRELGEAKTALRYYRLYIDKEPEADDGAEVREIIRALEEELGDAARPPTRRPPPDRDDDDDRRGRDDDRRGRDDDDDGYVSPEERAARAELGTGARYEAWIASGLTLSGYKRVRVGTGLLIGGAIAGGAGVVGILAIVVLSRTEDPTGNAVISGPLVTFGLTGSVVALVAGVYLVYYGAAVRRKGLGMRRVASAREPRFVMTPLLLPDGAGFGITGTF